MLTLTHLGECVRWHYQTRDWSEMPRWPVKPETWKPTDTEVNVPKVGTVQCVATYVQEPNEPWHDRMRTHWTVRLMCNGQTIESPFSQGSAHTKPPDATSVLSCLSMDAYRGSETFEEFCSDLGYDTDSRSAYDTWQTCRDTELRMRRMFGNKFDTVTEWGNEQ